MRYKKVLALSPHTDDVELGAGATLARLAEAGADIHFVAFSTPGPVLRNEMSRAIHELVKHHDIQSPETVLAFPRRQFPEHRQAILQWMIDHRDDIDPDLVLVPCSYDTHQDHQTVTAEALRAFKNVTIYGYILRWNCRSFHEDVRVQLKRKHLIRKMKALAEYKSQAKRPYFDAPFHANQAYVRGLGLDSHLAESFELINLVHSQGMEEKANV